MGKFDIDVRCMRCLKVARLSPPEDWTYTNKVTGWDFMIARVNEWLHERLMSGDDYILCPECMKRDLDRFKRFEVK